MVILPLILLSLENGLGLSLLYLYLPKVNKEYLIFSCDFSFPIIIDIYEEFLHLMF